MILTFYPKQNAHILLWELSVFDIYIEIHFIM